MNEETLILYYYRDGLNETERAAVAAALESDPVVRERYRTLSQALDGIREPTPAPASLDMVDRWQRTIADAAVGERAEADRGSRAWHLPSFAWGVALAAAVVTAVGIGFHLSDPPPGSQPIADGSGVEAGPAAPVAASASFTRGLEFHLRQARQEIAGLSPNDDVDRAQLIMDIVRQNRLFERTAHEHGAEDVARVLRAYEPVLLRLAGGNTGTEHAADLRTQLEFELGVMLTKMQRRESTQAETI